MKQISGTDALFLAIDTADSPAQIGGIAVIDPTDAPDFSFERFRAELATRIVQAPPFTRKVRHVPLRLGRPYWVDDPDFDIDRHLRRVAVPSPGTMRELAELCGDLFGQRLSRYQPLWEIWYIEGLENGRVATLQINHHCMVDGGSGRGLTELLYDVEPSPPPPAPKPRSPKAPRGREPGDLELLVRGVGATLLTPFRLSTYVYQAARRGIAALPYLTDPDRPPAMRAGVPRVSFNGRTGMRRGWSCTSVPFERIRAIKKHFDVKVNDVVLAVTASAVRRYLKAQGELPRESLAVSVPVSTRAAGDDTLGNQVASMMLPWHTDVEDPAERLLAIHESAMQSKEMTRAVRAREIQSMGDTAPPALINLAYRLAASAAADALPLPANAIVSNVPGPPIQLYIAGAKLEAMYPLSMVQAGMGLNITVMSYLGRVDFGFTVDALLVPDPWYLSDGIELGVAELEKAMTRHAPRRSSRSDAPAAPAAPPS